MLPSREECINDEGNGEVEDAGETAELDIDTDVGVDIDVDIDVGEVGEIGE